MVGAWRVAPPGVRARFGGTEVRKHCKHAPVAFLALGNVELHQDVAHMRLDGAVAQEEALCIAAFVRPSAISARTSRDVPTFRESPYFQSARRRS